MKSKPKKELTKEGLIEAALKSSRRAKKEYLKFLKDQASSKVTVKKSGKKTTEKS